MNASQIFVLVVALLALGALVYDNIREYRRRVRYQILSRELADTLWELLDRTHITPTHEEYDLMFAAGLEDAQIRALYWQSK